MWPLKRTLILGTSFFLAAGGYGCGQKGPLYFSPDSEIAEQTQDGAPPDPDNEDDSPSE